MPTRQRYSFGNFGGTFDHTHTMAILPELTSRAIQTQLAILANPKIAEHSQRFFKTGPGEYGEGDLFRGIRVPELRRVARAFKNITLRETFVLLKSAYHEDRFVALCLMVQHYDRGDSARRATVYEAYLSHAQWINSWDLVDTSAHKIVGRHLWEQDRAPLFDLAASSDLWERRIAVIATLFFIKKGDLGTTFALAERLLNDPHDLMHKAVGWMLREAGKMDFDAQDAFMRKHYPVMPRTMLRYAIERFPEPLRKAYIRGEVAQSS